MKAWPILAIAVLQGILLMAHWFLYRTWIDFWGPLSLTGALELQAALFVLALSFIFAALLGFRFSNPLVTLIYRVAAVWLGLLNFFFLAACLCWLTEFALRITPLAPSLPHYRPMIAVAFFSLALLAVFYGLLNARWVRVRFVPVQLSNLPEAWSGRTAMLVSDLHLGHVRGLHFSRRIAAHAERLQPDIILIPGDLFDGSEADPASLIAPLKALAPPFGTFFSSGNHDEFGKSAHYTAALTEAGIRVLANERVTIEGLQIVGITYTESVSPLHLRIFLESLRLAEGEASILLNHVPNRLPIVESAGVSLQLSGHTHGGQVFPFTWFTRRAFGKFTYGLQQFGALQVYTSSGAGTWGPPMRVGTHPEIVLLQFE